MQKRTWHINITLILKKSDHSEVFRYEQTGYDENDLLQQSSYIQLKEVQKETILRCYKKLTPYRKNNVLNTLPDPTENDIIRIGNYDFIKDAEEISKAIITVLYMLRCCLAHGDFTPDILAQNVYRYAYETLLTPLKKLI